MAGRIDDARREYERVRKSRGENNPDVVAAKTTLDALLARQGELQVVEARAAAEASIKIQPGELVTVSIMSLMGPDVETVKTTRVDANGNINLPYIKEIKAQGQIVVSISASMMTTVCDAAVSSCSPMTIRTTFGVSGKSREPAP